MLTIDYRSYCQVYVLLFGPLFVILFRLLHFLFQRDLVSVPLVSEYDLITS